MSIKCDGCDAPMGKGEGIKILDRFDNRTLGVFCCNPCLADYYCEVDIHPRDHNKEVGQ